jgi:hypothetical protein
MLARTETWPSQLKRSANRCRLATWSDESLSTSSSMPTTSPGFSAWRIGTLSASTSAGGLTCLGRFSILALVVRGSGSVPRLSAGMRAR